jgi:hypothetical protein
MSQSILTPEDVLASYNKYGKNFLVPALDNESVKENILKTVKYGNIKLKKVDGSEVIPVIKYVNLTTASKIKAPIDRDYEQLKLAVRVNDITNEDSKFGKAMQLIYDTYIEIIKDLVKEGKISDDEDDSDKPGCLYVKTCKPQTPLQKRAKDKTGKTVILENPMIWLGLNFKRYTKDEEKDLERLDFNYKKDGKPFLVKDFELNIYDLEKIQNRKPQLATVDGKKIDNTNVHKFITGNSLISGTIYMQVIMSSQSFNLNTKISKNLYVRSNKNPTGSIHMFDDDEFESMIEDSKKKLGEVSINEETKESEHNDEQEIDDYDEQDNLVRDKIKDLSFS